MQDWKTFDWYETRENLIERIRSNEQLDSVTQWIVVDLTELLLPKPEGGTFKRAVYPGIYEERRCDMDALAQKNGISRMTLWRHMNKLESAGVFVRRHDRSDTHLLLAHIKAMPLLAYPERIEFPPFSKVMYQNDTLINNYNDRKKEAVVLHLERRIGCNTRLIKATGKVDGRKYVHLREDVQADIEKYLQGERAHLYGSAPLLADGKTWQLEYDFDDKLPWLDDNHTAIQQQLALSGFASIYAKRRPGRGHLILLFSSPVEPEAAHQATLQAVPVLETCKEVYPVRGKRTVKISWPFFYRIEKEVHECAIVACYPDFPGRVVKSPGVCSDRDTTEMMFVTALNDASLAPPIMPVSCAKLPVDNENIAREVERAEFDACHTVTEVLGMRVNDRFISPWRWPREKTPSAVVVSERLVVDYGLENNSSGKPRYHGAWDCYVAKERRLL